MILHTVFDLLAISFAILSGWAVWRWRFRNVLEKTAARLGPGYFMFLSLGSMTGAFVFGTLNLYLSHTSLEVGRSILGALFGAICTVEFYKVKNGIRGSTGYIYVVPFCVAVIVGRIGCFLSGLKDNTYGVPTTLPWGWDFGDHILRHPVQLYESLSMLLFLLGIIAILKYKQLIVIKYGFYLCVRFYALQRFTWEFFKPYQKVFGPLNIFQVLCLILIVYSIVMIRKEKYDSRLT